MCRMAAYIGPEIPLRDLMLEPAYGLMEQSWGPREMKEGRLNADGYGFGWFAPDGRPAFYTNPMPIWTDRNLADLGRSLAAPQWLANVRSATRSMDISHANTQPFADDRYIFLHNGYVADFTTSLRTRIRQNLGPEIEAGVHGNTDSEYLFALFREIMAEHENFMVDQGLLELFKIIEEWAAGIKSLLNVIIGDGKRLYATRHAFNGECPSLYFTTEEENYPGGMLIASEPLTESGSWQPVPEHHMLILDTEQHLQLIPL